MKLLHVVGARPNYMKIAPIMLEASNHASEFEQVLVHTGQHYDTNMSDVFFDDLRLPTPNHFLGVGSGSHAQQTARVMIAFEDVVQEERPDIVVVAGDVNSTLACTLVSVKLGIPVAHVEAGLRSFDRTMPEEINRILTDRISSVLFTPSIDGDRNLLAEGIESSRIVRVGNVMIDTLMRLLPKAKMRWYTLHKSLNLDEFVLVTLHRPSNVDSYEQLRKIFDALNILSNEISIVFPIHPRTRQKMRDSDINCSPMIRLIEPLGYLDFLGLESTAKLVITDSGGVQEETTFLNIPCLTIRPNTERPITIEYGTNRLISGETNAIIDEARRALNRSAPISTSLDLWDGKAATRIIAFLLNNSITI